MTERPLNIGIVCYPTFGGSGIIATELGAAMAARGHRVHVMSYDVPIRHDHGAHNLFFHEVVVRDYPLFKHPPYSLALASTMVQVCEWEQLDLLHVHYAVPHAASALLARQALRGAAPKVITTLHGTDITLVGIESSYLPITRLAIEASDGVTTPSQFLAEATYDLLDVSREVPIEVIPNFVDTDRFAPSAERDPAVLRQLFGPNGHEDETPILFHISNFRPVKRVLDLVQVFAAVCKERPARLILVGDGPDRSRAEAEVHRLGLPCSVRFLGKQEHFIDLLQMADLFLLPSATESFGLAALEAMSCGVPVVASDVGGLPELVDHGETGLLVRSGDTAAMARAVVELLDDRPRRHRMARRAREVAVERFRLEPSIDRYEAYYRRLTAQGDPP